MRKSSSNNPGLPPQTERLQQVVDDLVFLPTLDQRRIKAAFWAKYANAPQVDVSKVTAAHVQRFIEDSRIPRWWSMYGFREWFLNEDEFRQRSEYLAHLAQDTLEQIMLDPDANHNAKVNAAKLAIEVANRMPQKWQKITYLDDSIQKMDQAQLEQFIKQKSITAGSFTGDTNEQISVEETAKDNKVGILEDK